MAKLFANKFNLDQLPDPVKPNPTPVQADVIRVEPVVPKSIDTQALNARLREVGNQRANILTSDQILEQQGVTKSAAEQYVSRTKVEPFGQTPINQGTANIKLPNEVANKTSDIDIKPVDQGSKITDPKIEINKVDQGSKITDPKTQVQKIQPGDRIVNPETTIKLVDQGEKITNPDLEIQKVKTGDRIVNPNTPITLVDQNEFIINPNTIVNKIVEGDRIVNPNIVINRIKDGDRITDPKIKTVKVDADELIINPNTKIIPVNVNELIVNPNIVTQPTSPVTHPTIPLYGGIGVTKLFPRNISLKDRLQQDNLGTTRHLPEYILSDVNTGYITIKNPKVVEILSRVTIQKVAYENTILKQGGLEDILKGITSFINPLKYGENKVNQGSIKIKNIATEQKKISPVQIQKVRPGDRITDPKTIINYVEPGERTTDPQTKINKIEPGDRIVDPKIKVVPVNPNEMIVDPEIEVVPVDPNEKIVNPDIKIKKVIPDSLIVDPKLDIKPIVPGERTVDPKTKVAKVKPGERTVDPQTEIVPVEPGERTFDPKTVINPVRPGARTTDPKTKVPKVAPGSRTYIPYIPLFPFLETDDKTFYTEEPVVFENNYDVFPSEGIVPLSGEVVSLAPTPGTVFPGETTPQGSNQPVFIDQVGITYTNQYNTVYRYNVDDKTSYLKDAADRGGNTPLLTKVYDVASSTVIENKEVAFPPAQNGDYRLPGGYRTLNYAQIQRRGSNNDRRNLDFTYEEGPGALTPWRQRLGMPDQGADTINNSVNATARDLVTIKLVSGRDNSILQFRSYLKAFSDNYTAQYNDVNYIGRPDTLKVFKGTTRQLSLGFVVPVMSEDELEIVYQKLNKLVQNTSMGTINGYYLQGPFMKLTVGGWCKNTPIIVTSLKFETNPSEYTWDIIHEVPQIVDVSLDCTALSDNTGDKPFLADGTYISYGA